MSIQTDKKFDTSGRFLLENYTQARPFSSFLPGIAGPHGIPLWVFYVNRGQAIAAFGMENKDNPIMEFQPANKAYRQTPTVGFRTFIKATRNGTDSRFYEPFAPWTNGDADPMRTMAVGTNDLVLREVNPSAGLTTQVTYFTLTGEPFAGLVRRVTITNTGDLPVNLEILDGLPAIMPYGVDDSALKNISRTIEAWMEVFNLERGVPFYRLRASSEDSAEVSAIQAGHFYLAVAKVQGVRQDGRDVLPVLVDPRVVFGSDTSLVRPQGFLDRPLADLVQSHQITVGQTPCGFSAARASLEPGQHIVIRTIIGHVGDLSVLEQHLPRLAAIGYAPAKHAEAIQLASQLTDVVKTHTANPRLDAYIRQNFLDNVLRGGWPVNLGAEDRPVIYHIYSRKHGDLERDYNAFYLSAEPFSQGNGNYRDVNQNRRSDVLLSPQVGDYNVRTFLSLLQADGYNPLVVRGSRFTLNADRRAALQDRLGLPDQVMDLLVKPFTPGHIVRATQDRGIQLPLPVQDFVVQLLANADQHFSADFGEGYWADHWTYNLDLIENYLAVYPDRQNDLLFGRADLPFFDSPATVRPRSQRYVLAENGPRQFNAVYESPEKEAMIHARAHANAATPNLVRTRHGQGEIYRTTVFGKLLILSTIKFATLDPAGMGVEMEGGKPGWYDALNGLPGLFGSSMPESYELLRLINFLLGSVADLSWTEAAMVRLPVEVVDLLQQLADLLNAYDADTSENRDFRYWVGAANAREHYQASVRLGFDGHESSLDLDAISLILGQFRTKLLQGIERSQAFAPVPPTYFVHQVTDYEILRNEVGDPLVDGRGRPTIRVHGFSPRPLPPFLEGPVRALRVIPNVQEARRIHEAVLESELYDRKLGMFKVNASLLEEAHDIGRARAFAPGWLENESIWMHMAYKYLLSLLLSGLVDEFYTAAQSGLVPFMDPSVYGRSPLENSSFIASSAHPDESIHGAGFVARLSGATAEFIHIWTVMMAGPQPFITVKGAVALALRPALAEWLFDDQNQVSFTFLGTCAVTYHNPSRQDTFGPDVTVQRYVIHPVDGDAITVDGSVLSSSHALGVRNGKIRSMDVYLG